MTINAINFRPPGTPIIRARVGSAGTFTLGAEHTEDPSGGANAVSGASPVALDVLLAAEALARQDRDEPARRRAMALLSRLAALQRALLASGSRTESLHSLATLLQNRPPVEDPDLAEPLDAITLRASVAIALHSW